MAKHQETKKCINIYRRNHGNQNEAETTDSQQNDDNAGPTFNHYCISINGNTETACPGTGCMFSTAKPYNMRQHFRDRHVKDIIHIIEEGTQPLPRCPKCGIFQKEVGEKHQQTKVCQKFALRAEILQAYKQNQTMATEVKFKVFDVEIEQVHEFKYLGRWVTDDDVDKLAIQRNFEKALRTWGRLHRLLSQERTRNIKLVVSVYQAIVCQQLLFGSETWILSNQRHKMLESFHRRCVRFLTGDFIKKLPNGDWHYPKTEDVMQKAGLKSIKQYIEQRRKNVEVYMTVESESITELAESVNIEINMERVIWWNNKPEPGPSQPTT